MSTSAESTRRPWYRRRSNTGHPTAPWGVRTVTTIVIVFAILGLIRSGLLFVAGIVAVAEGKAPGLVVALVGGAVVVAIFYLWLAYKTRHGRFWAWITMLVLLGLVALLGLAIFASGFTTGDNSAVAGLALAVVPLAMILLLTAPRGSRDYFLRPEAYSARQVTPVAGAPMIRR